MSAVEANLEKYLRIYTTRGKEYRKACCHNLPEGAAAPPPDSLRATSVFSGRPVLPSLKDGGNGRRLSVLGLACQLLQKNHRAWPRSPIARNSRKCHGSFRAAGKLVRVTVAHHSAAWRERGLLLQSSLQLMGFADL